MQAGQGLALIISGPSGVGKTTIVRHVREALDAVFSVSWTTRPKTAEDVEGQDYHFVSMDDFINKRDAGELLEWAEVFGHCYGTPAQPMAQALDAGRLFIMDVDVQGAIQIRRNVPDAFGVFILPPDEDTLLDRLRRRGRESEDVIQKRFAKAKWEIGQAKRGGVYDVFLVNDDLEAAKARAVAVIREHWDRVRTGSNDPADASAGDATPGPAPRNP